MCRPRILCLLRSKIQPFSAGVFSRSESFCKRKSASKEFAAGPIPAAQKPPAFAACMPASASSTTSASSGFTLRSFAANKNTSGSGLEWVICVPSATASKKLPSPMRSRISGAFLLDDPKPVYDRPRAASAVYCAHLRPDRPVS